QLLVARVAGRRAARDRLSAGTGEAAVRAAAGVSRQRWPARTDRRILRPSRGIFMVRSERGKGPALPISRLEIRCDGPMHRRAVRTRGKRLLPEDQTQVLPADRARRCAVDLYGSEGTHAAIPRMGIRHGAEPAAFRFETMAGVELAAGHGGRHRLEPRVVPAPR